MANDESRVKSALEVGVVGLGRCGGNLAAEFAARGYSVLAVDTSATDLELLSGLGAEQKVFVNSGAETGSAGSLEEGGARLTAAAEVIVAGVERELKNVDIALVIGGLGGGTGGGLATVAAAVRGADFPVIAMGILPAASDGYHVRYNAVHAVQQLVDVPLEALVFVDNAKLFPRFGEKRVDQLLVSCNRMVVDRFECMRRMTTTSGPTLIRSFELQDLERILAGGGVMSYGHTALNNALASTGTSLGESLDGETLLQAFVEVVNDNDVLATEFDLEDTVAIGSLITAPENVLAETPAAVFESFREEVALVTNGAVHHIGVYRVQTGVPLLQVVVSGLALPSRVRDLVGALNAEADHMTTKRTAVWRKLKQLDLGGLVDMVPPPSSRRMLRHEDTDDTQPSRVDGDSSSGIRGTRPPVDSEPPPGDTVESLRVNESDLVDDDHVLDVDVDDSSSAVEVLEDAIMAEDDADLDVIVAEV